MTLINLVVQPKSRKAYIICDTAYFHPDGRVAGIAPKVAASTRAPWAFGVAGNVSISDILIEFGAEAPSDFETLERLLPAAMASAVAKTAAGNNMPPDTVSCRLIGAAWVKSEKRIMGFYIDSSDSGDTGARAYEIYETNCILTNITEADLAGWFGARTCDLADPATFDPIPDGMKLVHRQRHMSHAAPGRTACLQYGWFGGTIQMITISRDGIEAAALHDYGDKVGRTISVTKDEGSLSFSRRLIRRPS